MRSFNPAILKALLRKLTINKRSAIHPFQVIHLLFPGYLEGILAELNDGIFIFTL